MSWLDSLLEATEEAETPRSYIYWAGISIISSVIAPNVYINRGGMYKLQPNTFIFLIGESGLGKGLPLNIARKLTKIVGTTRLIDGSNTIQSIIYELGNSETDLKSGVPKWKDSRGFIVSNEFATLLQDDKLALPTLTELYDTHYIGGVDGTDWNKKTKSAGKDKLLGTCVTFFAGSTPEHFQNTVPEHDVKGGFVGRLLTVYEEKRYKINALEDTNSNLQIPYDHLATWLMTLGKLQGPFDWIDIKTKNYWKEWYGDIKNPTRKIYDPTGAINRLPDNILKVAMCISLARQNERLVISYEDLDEAISKCMSLTVDSKRLTGGKGKSQVGEQVHFVTQVLYRAAVDKERITKGMLLRKYYGQFDLYELDRIISTLEAADLCKSTPMTGPPIDVLLEMPEGAVRNIQAFMQRRQL